MAIEVRCPTSTCGHVLTVHDRLAGLEGVCPACGAAIVIPGERPLDVPGDDEARERRSKTVAFGAIGVAWRMLLDRPGLWLGGTLLVGLASAVAQAVIGLATAAALGLMAGLQVQAARTGAGLAATVLVMVLGLPLPMIAAVAVQGVFLSGLFRLALRQADGHDVRLGDAFALREPATGAAVGAVWLLLGFWLGSMLLIIPGYFFLGLSMFVLPAVVDGELGASDAFRRSWAVLEEHWFSATLFQIAIYAMLTAGTLLLGLGVLFTFPLYILATTVQYRRSFAPGARLRPNLLENPYASARGVPRSEQSETRVPRPAWLLMGLGLATPIIAVAGLVVLGPGFLLPGPNGVASPRTAVTDVVISPAWNQVRQPVFQPPPNPPQIQVRQPLAETARRTPALNTPPEPPSRFPTAAAAVAELKKRKSTQAEVLRDLITRRVVDRERPIVVNAVLPFLGLQRFQSEAAQVLKRWASEREVPVLIARLNDRRDAVRASTMRILEGMSDPRIPGPMVLRLLDPRDRDLAMSILPNMAKCAGMERVLLSHLSRGDPTIRADVKHILLTPNAFSYDIALTVDLALTRSDDPRTRADSFSNLAETEPVTARHRTLLAAAFVRAFDDRDSGVRAAAAAAVKRREGAGIIPGLIRLLDDPVPEVKVAAVGSLMQHREAEILPALVAHLGDHDIGLWARQAINAWGSSAEHALVKGLSQPDPKARRSVCELLGKHGSAASLDPLRGAIDDPDPTVSNAARTATGRLEQRLQPSQPAPDNPDAGAPR